jgi:hypothetical protein
MTEQEFNQKLFANHEYWFSPSWITDTFDYYEKQYSLKVVLEHKNSKKLKEMWATATFLLGYQKFTETEQWLKPCYDTTPDVFAACFVPSERMKDSQDLAILNVEVTEWEGRTTQTLTERILNKLKDKKYPKDYQLLVHITRQGELNINMDKIYKDLEGRSLDIHSIWVLAGNSTPRTWDNYSIWRVFPSRVECNLSLSGEVVEDKKRRQVHLLKNQMKRKGTGISLHIGKTELPTLD